MKTTFIFFKYSILCLFGTFMILSCGGNSQKTEDLASAKEEADDKFRNALRENLSDVATTNEISAQEIKRAAEEEIAAQKRLERERLEQEQREKSAPYGYNQFGEPYASQDWKNLDKAFDEFEKARQGYINATSGGNPMDLMYYHQRMKLQIGNCLGYARKIGDRDIIEKMTRLDRWVDNLQY